MSLDITTRCTLSHINLRKEGGDDCPSTAVDLKLTGMETDIGTLALLHDTDDPEYPGEWIETDDGPACTAFVERVRPCVRRNRAAARRAGQADIFGAAP